MTMTHDTVSDTNSWRREAMFTPYHPAASLRRSMRSVVHDTRHSERGVRQSANDRVGTTLDGEGTETKRGFVSRQADRPDRPMEIGLLRQRSNQAARAHW